jgi:hypothetical protein
MRIKIKSANPDTKQLEIGSAPGMALEDLQKSIENTIQRLNEPGLHARIKQQEEAELEALRSELQAGANSWDNEQHLPRVHQLIY